MTARRKFAFADPVDVAQQRGVGEQGCARADDDGYIWVMGRVDDVLNVSGHRLSTMEVESALVAHKTVAEAAVVGYNHPIKGQGIWAYVTLKEVGQRRNGQYGVVCWLGNSSL